MFSVGNRDIKSLNVNCDNKKCEWKGTVGTLAVHLVTCECTSVPCSNKCVNESGEINHFMRKHLYIHLILDCPNRDYKCEYCGEKGTYANITTAHDEICEKKDVFCTNIECSQIMKRQKIANHVKDSCQYTVIACKTPEHWL